MSAIQGPQRSGGPRQGAPERTIHTMPGFDRFRGLPGDSPADERIEAAVAIVRGEVHRDRGATRGPDMLHEGPGCVSGAAPVIGAHAATPPPALMSSVCGLAPISDGGARSWPWNPVRDC